MADDQPVVVVNNNESSTVEEKPAPVEEVIADIKAEIAEATEPDPAPDPKPEPVPVKEVVEVADDEQPVSEPGPEAVKVVEVPAEESEQPFVNTVEYPPDEPATVEVVKVKDAQPEPEPDPKGLPEESALEPEPEVAKVVEAPAEKSEQPVVSTAEHPSDDPVTVDVVKVEESQPEPEPEVVKVVEAPATGSEEPIITTTEYPPDGPAPVEVVKVEETQPEPEPEAQPEPERETQAEVVKAAEAKPESKATTKDDVVALVAAATAPEPEPDIILVRPPPETEEDKFIYTAAPDEPASVEPAPAKSITFVEPVKDEPAPVERAPTKSVTFVEVEPVKDEPQQEVHPAVHYKLASLRRRDIVTTEDVEEEPAPLFRHETMAPAKSITIVEPEPNPRDVEENVVIEPNSEVPIIEVSEPPEEIMAEKVADAVEAAVIPASHVKVVEFPKSPSPSRSSLSDTTVKITTKVRSKDVTLAIYRNDRSSYPHHRASYEIFASTGASYIAFRTKKGCKSFLRLYETSFAAASNDTLNHGMSGNTVKTTSATPTDGAFDHAERGFKFADKHVGRTIEADRRLLWLAQSRCRNGRNFRLVDVENGGLFHMHHHLTWNGCRFDVSQGHRIFASLLFEDNHGGQLVGSGPKIDIRHNVGSTDHLIIKKHESAAPTVSSVEETDVSGPFIARSATGGPLHTGTTGLEPAAKGISLLNKRNPTLTEDGHRESKGTVEAAAKKIKALNRRASTAKPPAAATPTDNAETTMAKVLAGYSKAEPVDVSSISAKPSDTAKSASTEKVIVSKVDGAASINSASSSNSSISSTAKKDRKFSEGPEGAHRGIMARIGDGKETWSIRVAEGTDVAFALLVSLTVDGISWDRKCGFPSRRAHPKMRQRVD